MQVSAEIRWFWPVADVPDGLVDWFRWKDHHGCSAGGGKERVDRYIHDTSQTELGIKLRGGRSGAEVKGLVALRRDGLACDPFAGPVELWSKWTSGVLTLDAQPLVAITKQRWLRKFSTMSTMPEEIPLGEDERPLANNMPFPTRGCNVECTRVTVPGGDTWWTLGLESFGTIETIENDLRMVAASLSLRQPPQLQGGIVASYPAWLKMHISSA